MVVELITNIRGCSFDCAERLGLLLGYHLQFVE
jgi:hypothetical protein